MEVTFGIPSSGHKPAPKRPRTNKPCDHCRSKKIRCEFPQVVSPRSNQEPCLHCTDFGIDCRVRGIQRNGSTREENPPQETASASPRYPGRELPEASLRTTPRPGQRPVPPHDDPGQDALSTGVGILSLAGSQEARFLGSSSGFPWARLISTTLQREGVLPRLGLSALSDSLSLAHPSSPRGTFTPPLLPPPLPPAHLRPYYFDVAYKHIQARYACIDWVQVRKWHEQADLICASQPGENPNIDQNAGSIIARDAAVFFLCLVYGYGSRMTEDEQLPGAMNHEVFYNAALTRLPTIACDRSLLAVQAQLFLTLYMYRHPASELSLWRLGGSAFRAAQEIGLHRRVSNAKLESESRYHEELRRRTFWTAYILDRMSSIQLGRPFFFHDQDIDLPLPSNIDDGITAEAILSTLPVGSLGASSDRLHQTYHDVHHITTMSAFLHSARLNQIRTAIHDCTYQVGGRGRPSSGNLDAVLSALSEWRSRHPVRVNIGDCPVQLSTEHWEMEYHQSVQILLRPVCNQPDREAKYAPLCAESAAGLCENQWTQIKINPRNMSSSALYRLFLSGLSLIYLALRFPSSIATTRDLHTSLEYCLRSLEVFAKQYPWATSYAAFFSQLHTSFVLRSPAAAAKGPQEQSTSQPTDGPDGGILASDWVRVQSGGFGEDDGAGYPMQDSTGGNDGFEGFLSSFGLQSELSDLEVANGVFPLTMDPSLLAAWNMP